MNNRAEVLDILREELKIEFADQEERSKTFDSRASLVIGVTLAILGFGNPGAIDWLIWLSAALGIGALFFSGKALWFRTSNVLIPRKVREIYIDENIDYDSYTVKQDILDTRIRLYELDQIRLDAKVAALKVATICLGLSILCIIVSNVGQLVKVGG